MSSLQSGWLTAWTVAVFFALAGVTRAEDLPLPAPGMTDDQKKQIAVADKVGRQAEQLIKAGKFAEALPVAQRSLQMRYDSVGKGHPQTNPALHQLGRINKALGDYEPAAAAYLEGIANREKYLGPNHSKTGFYITELAHIYLMMGNYGGAREMYDRAVKMDTVNGQDGTLEQAVGFWNVATLCMMMGDYSRAEPLLLRAIGMVERNKGESADLTNLLGQLGNLYREMGELEKAEAALMRALEIDERLFGRDHKQAAISMHNLALVYVRYPRRQAQAEALLKRSLEIARAERTPASWLSNSLNALGLMYAEQGDFEKAEPLLKEALALAEKKYEGRPYELVFERSNLALFYEYQDKNAEAEMLVRQVCDSELRRAQAAALAQSDRQQLAMNRECRFYFDHYLRIAVRSKKFDAQAYEYWVAYKGSVCTRQQLRLAKIDDPTLRPKFVALQDVTAKLANLALHDPSNEEAVAWRQQVTELSQAKEQVELELNRASLGFKAAQHRTSPDEMRAALNDDTALVDFTIYHHCSTPAPGREQAWHQRVAAFIVRKNLPIKLIDLGPAQEISQAIQDWRASGYGTAEKGRKAGEYLRATMWEPLESWLNGAKVVHISPEGEISSLPFAALPGRKTRTYLIEEYVLDIVPVPSALVVEQRAPTPERVDALLAIGDVDYDLPEMSAVDPKTFVAQAVSPLRAARGEKDSRFNALPGTGAEVIAIGKEFRTRFPKCELKRLRGTEATESAFCTAAPNYRYLHLATHGFFADSAVRSALMRELPSEAATPLQSDQRLLGYHPDLLSGVALAGANRRDNNREDGILTAAEVQALDMRRVDLVSLSACETGLGLSAGGEGLLGLQRAFQVAGAQNVVASLWKVDDAATQALMTEFYRNLWERNLSPRDALRQAQLRMIVHYEPKSGKLRAGLSSKPIDEAALAEARAQLTYEKTEVLPPFYWAAFVISGNGK